MKFLKLVAVPAVLGLGLLTAVPARAGQSSSRAEPIARNVLEATFSAPCEQGTQVCFAVTGSVGPGTGERRLTFELVAVLGITSAISLGTTTVSIPANRTDRPQPLPAGLGACFPVRGLLGRSTLLELKGVTDGNGNPADLTVVTPSQPSPVVYTGTSQPTVSVVILFPTPASLPACGLSPPSVSRTSGTALAPTGGFDFRYLGGLVVLLSGLGLLVVGARRGGSRRSRD